MARDTVADTPAQLLHITQLTDIVSRWLIRRVLSDCSWRPSRESGWTWPSPSEGSRDKHDVSDKDQACEMYRYNNLRLSRSDDPA